MNLFAKMILLLRLVHNAFQIKRVAQDFEIAKMVIQVGLSLNNSKKKMNGSKVQRVIPTIISSNVLSLVMPFFLLKASQWSYNKSYKLWTYSNEFSVSFVYFKGWRKKWIVCRLLQLIMLKILTIWTDAVVMISCYLYSFDV